MDITRLIKSIVIGLVALFLCLYIGIGAATAQKETVMKITLVVGGLVCIAMGNRIWLLLPFAQFSHVTILRGFSFYEMAQMIFIGMCVIMFLMRRLTITVKFGEMDKWTAAVLFCLLQSYVRAPVGLNVFGAEVVGGRPYFLIIIGVMASWILGNYNIRSGDLKLAMWLNILGVFASMPMNKLRWGSFSGGGGGSTSDYSAANVYTYGQGGASRDGGLGVYAVLISKIICSRISPLKAAFHPALAPIVLFSLYLAAASGFRNSVGHVGLVYIVGVIYRGGLGQTLLSFVVFAFLLAVLSFANLVKPFPPNVQRTLTVFPGTWEERYKNDAAASTEWRVTMWEKAIFTDKYIENKVIGDGLGITRQQMRDMLEEEQRGSGMGSDGLTGQQRNMMIAGGYHSGPVETIRAVGYTGLAVFLLAMFRLAVHAHRQIMRCKGTEWYPVALFFGIPAIVHPLFWTFLFGAYGEGVVTYLFGVAIIKLMQHNLPLPAYVPRSNRTYQPLLHRQAGPQAV